MNDLATQPYVNRTRLRLRVRGAKITILGYNQNELIETYWLKTWRRLIMAKTMK